MPNNKDPEAITETTKFHESHAGDGTAVHEHHLTGPPLYLSFSACFVCFFLIGLDQTVVVTMLTTVGAQFEAYDKIGWVASGYVLTMAVFSQTWGRLSIIFGRKYSLVASIFLFELGSLVCALANSMNMLIGGRVLAGIGGGGIQTLVFIVGTEMVSAAKRPLAFLILAVGFSSASVTGPLIGGGFTENITWRWCFYINLPLGGVAFVALMLFYNPPMPHFTWRQKFEQIDYVGTFLMTTGLVLTLLGMTLGGEEFVWDSAAVILCFVLGGVLLILFLVWNFRFSKHQIIPTALAKTSSVMIPVLGLFFLFYSFFSMAVYAGTYYQVVRGAGPISVGYQFFGFVIPTVLTNIIVGLLMKRTRYIKPYAVVGGIFSAVGFGLICLFATDSTSAQKIGYLILPGIGFGALFQTSMMSAQLSSPGEAGSAILTTSLFNFSRSLGSAVGGALAQAVFDATLKNKIANALVAHSSAFKGLDVTASMVNNPNTIKLLPEDARVLVVDCVMSAITAVFYTTAASAAVAGVLSFFYSNKRVPTEEEVKSREEYEMELKRDGRVVIGDQGGYEKPDESMTS